MNKTRLDAMKKQRGSNKMEKTYVSECTFSQRPAANKHSGKRCVFTDMGENGSVWKSDGTTWNPEVGSVLLYKNKYPILVPSSGTLDNNTTSGTTNQLTLTTTLVNSYTDGLWVYLPDSDAIELSVNTAGFFFADMGSATVGTLVGSYETLPNNAPDTSAFTVLSDAAFVGPAAIIKVASVDLPANSLRKGTIRVKALIQKMDTSTASIDFVCKLNTSIFGLVTMATTTAGQKLEQDVCSLGGAKQVSGNISTNANLLTAATDIDVISEDLTADATIDLYITKTEVLDFAMILSAEVWLIG